MELEHVSEEYREKRYPQGSVLARSSEKNRKSSVTLVVLLALVAAALGAAGCYFISLIRYHQQAGHSESVTIGWVFFGIVAVLFLLCVWGITKALKGAKAGPEATIAATAKRNGLSEEEVRAFDQQALQSDSYILPLKGAVGAAMANQADGLLTRDYLWLGDVANGILRRTDLAGACLYRWSYYAGKKRLYAISMAVVDKSGRMISAEADSEKGRVVLNFLAQQNPGLRVAEATLKEGKEFDGWREGLTEEKGE